MSKLDTVSKLLAKAENAGTPEEAESFMEGAMRLAAQNGIDLAVARLHRAQKEKREEPEERRIQVNPYSRKHNRKHFIELAMHIADVNDCKYLIGGRDHTLLAVGFPSDLDVLEAMYIHLSVQMVAQCDSALRCGANRETRRVPKQTWEDIPEDEIDWGGWCDGDGGYYYNDSPSYPKSKSYDPPSRRLVPVLGDDGLPIIETRSVALTDGRVFRQDFYEAFTARMHAKLWASKRQAMKDAGVEPEGSNSTSLAILDKTAEINKASEEQRAKVHHLGVWKGQERNTFDYTGKGREHGRDAAERTSLGDSKAMKQTPEIR